MLSFSLTAWGLVLADLRHKNNVCECDKVQSCRLHITSCMTATNLNVRFTPIRQTILCALSEYIDKSQFWSTCAHVQCIRKKKMYWCCWRLPQTEVSLVVVRALDYKLDLYSILSTFTELGVIVWFDAMLHLARPLLRWPYVCIDVNPSRYL